MIASWQKSYDKSRQCVKSKDITLLTKVCLVKAMVFPVVMYGYESWTIKKADRQRIDAFGLWCWRRLLKVPWTARRSNQSINPEYSLEGLRLMLKLQYFGHLMWTDGTLGKSPMLGKIEGRRRRWHFLLHRKLWEFPLKGGGWDSWMASLMQGTLTLGCFSP